MQQHHKDRSTIATQPRDQIPGLTTAGHHMRM
jgi:hypothetical protein